MPITVSTELYKEIEADLEEYYNKELSHWDRIWENGKKAGYKAVVERFDLMCDVIENELIVKLKNNRTFDIVWQRNYNYD